MADIRISEAPDGTLVVSGITSDEAWMIAVALSNLETDHNDFRGAVIGTALHKWLNDSGFRDW